MRATPTRLRGRRRLIARKLMRVLRARGREARGRDLLRNVLDSLRAGHESIAIAEIEEFLRTVEDVSFEHRTILNQLTRQLGWKRFASLGWLVQAIGWLVQTVLAVALSSRDPSVNSLACPHLTMNASKP